MATLNIKNFPDPLYEKLKELARQEHRSLAQQVIHILQEAVDSESAFLLEPDVDLAEHRFVARLRSVALGPRRGFLVV